jgi:hypothetical protein
MNTHAVMLTNSDREPTLNVCGMVAPLAPARKACRVDVRVQPSEAPSTLRHCRAITPERHSLRQGFVALFGENM